MASSGAHSPKSEGDGESMVDLQAPMSSLRLTEEVDPDSKEVSYYFFKVSRFFFLKLYLYLSSGGFSFINMYDVEYMNL